MPHIHTGPGEIDHTVTAYIIRDDMEEPRVLLHRHKKLNKLLPVGGHIEINETPWAAMAHEIEEESGYLLDDLDILQPTPRIGQYDEVIVHPQPLIMTTHDITDEHFHSDTSYLFVAHDDPKIELADDESADIRWLTHSELIALDPAEIWDNTRGTYLQALELFYPQWEYLPASAFSVEKIVKD